MQIQVLSDLHLETEAYVPQPAPGAELLILAGDIDSTWAAFEAFAGWPQPVLVIAGNHEFDRRELADATPALRAHCARYGMTFLERESTVLPDRDGKRIRFVGTTRWCDFDLYGESGRAKALRAGGYFMQLMGATRGGLPLDAEAVRAEALDCRHWLQTELARASDAWDATVVVTHFAPSLRSADPRYGAQNATASFCNADDDLLPAADLWIHGHLHCTHDYRVEHARGQTRVVCNARGHERKGEAERHDPLLLLEV
jgi:predicted phosphodiesterase